ncbi:hypothetical protein M422DRAFT_270326 [Sphaerobolus stellatus SS14]|uniref:Uncharacterized protein n=1 Tax=Sphaerobolus stellatus (strain SS14) TaxID=990650 RepID=A0A0C9UHK6_SPHS4|nr:hypothetical protein M422DRAFT_270326 [Sphaerobolus stellatus SS14]
MPEGGRAVLDVNASFDGPNTAWTWRIALPNAGFCAPTDAHFRSLAAVNVNSTVSPSHKLMTLHQIRLRPTIELESRSFISLVLIRQTPSSDKSSMRITLGG